MTRTLQTRALALLMILVAVIVGVITTVTISYNASQASQAEQTSLLTLRYLAVATAGSTNAAVGDLIQLNNALLANDRAGALAGRATVTRDIATTNDLMRRLRGLRLDRTEAVVRDTDLRATEAFVIFVGGFQGVGAHSDSDTLHLVPGAINAWQRATAGVEPFIDAEVRQNSADELARSNFARQTLLGAGVLALTSVFLLGVVVFRFMLHPIVDLAQAASALSAGADAEIKRSGRQDEIGDLGRALEAWRQSTRHRLAMSEATVALNESHDTGELLALSASTLVDMTGAQRVTITVLRDGELVVAGSAPQALEAELAGSPAIPQGPAALAAHTQSPVIGDLTDSEWYETWLQLPVIAGCGPLMALPLISGGQVVGAAVCFRPAGDLAFTDADVASCQVVTTRLAAAIRVGNIFEELVQTRAALDLAVQNKSTLMANVVEATTVDGSQVTEPADDIEPGDLSGALLNQDQGLIVLPAGAVP